VCPHAQVEGLGDLGLHEHLVGAAGICHAALDDGEPIEVEAVLVDAPQAVPGSRGEGGEIGGRAVRPQGEHVEPRCTLNLFDVRKTGNRTEGSGS